MCWRIITAVLKTPINNDTTSAKQATWLNRRMPTRLLSAIMSGYSLCFRTLNKCQSTILWRKFANLLANGRRQKHFIGKHLRLLKKTKQTAVGADAALALGSLLFLSNPEAHKEALGWLLQAQQQFEQLNDQQGIGRVLERLSFIYSQQGNYEQALDYANQQLQIARQYNDPVGISGALDFVGGVYFLQGNFDKAKVTFKEAIAVAQDADYKRGLILANSDLAGVYWQSGDYHQSLGLLTAVPNSFSGNW